MINRIGQKVTQIKPIAWPCPNGETIPQFGVVYTVREITQYMGCAFLKFREITNPSLRYRDFTGEMDFLASMFRPIVETEADISIFTSMLTPNKQKVDA